MSFEQLMFIIIGLPVFIIFCGIIFGSIYNQSKLSFDLPVIRFDIDISGKRRFSLNTYDISVWLQNYTKADLRQMYKDKIESWKYESKKILEKTWFGYNNKRNLYHSLKRRVFSDDYCIFEFRFVRYYSTGKSTVDYVKKCSLQQLLMEKRDAVDLIKSKNKRINNAYNKKYTDQVNYYKDLYSVNDEYNNFAHINDFIMCPNCGEVAFDYKTNFCNACKQFYGKEKDDKNIVNENEINKGDINKNTNIFKHTIVNEKISQNVVNKFEKKRRVTQKQRQRILRRDNFTCRLCGAKGPGAGGNAELEVDHIKPFSLNGKDDDSNLWTLCKDCNRGKSNNYDDTYRICPYCGQVSVNIVNKDNGQLECECASCHTHFIKKFGQNESKVNNDNLNIQTEPKKVIGGASNKLDLSDFPEFNRMFF